MFKLSRNRTKKPSSVVVVDLGTSSFKLLHLQRKSGRFLINEAASYILSDDARENRTESYVSDGLRQLLGQAHLKNKALHLTINCPSTLIRNVETPAMDIDDIRKAIRLGAAAYLRQDCSDYFLDCAALGQSIGDADGAAVSVADAEKPAPASTGKTEGKVTKVKVLVAGAHKSDVRFYVGSASKAGSEVHGLGLSQLAAVNAFEYFWGGTFKEQGVAVIDIGFRSSSLNLVKNGTPTITRLVDWGGANITQYISEMLSVEWKTAEEEKLKMTEPVQHLVRDSLAGLVKHVRVSLDFFDNEYGTTPVRVGLAGASAQSPWIVQCLSEMLGMPCDAWKPGDAFVVGSKARSGADQKKLGPEMACVAGAAVSFLV